MSSIKKLIGQTALYGISSIFARLLNYLLTPLYTFIFAEKGNGEISIIYAFITFLNIVFTFGLETYFFRNSKENKIKIYNQSMSFLIFINILGIIIFLLFSKKIESFLYSSIINLTYYILGIVVLDSLSTIPFAILRIEQKVKKYVLIKTIGVGLNIGLNLYFLILCPYLYKNNNSNILLIFYSKSFSIEYILISNLIASFFTLILVLPILKQWKWSFNLSVFKKIFNYSFPLVIVGFSGMINEVIDRLMLPHFINGSYEYKMSQNGIYAATYKLSILITLFIQAFRMGAEPFFFKYSEQKNSAKTYATIMNYFIIVCCFGFLIVMLFLNFWQYFISINKHPKFAEGLKVLPILLCSNIFLGIYYNISIWYKLKDKTFLGSLIAILGALITIIGNYFFINKYSYVASAWTTFICYFSMVIIAYLGGRKYFPVPYSLNKIFIYISSSVILGLLHYSLFFKKSFFICTTYSLFFLAIFLIIVFLIEKISIKDLFYKLKIYKNN